MIFPSVIIPSPISPLLSLHCTASCTGIDTLSPLIINTLSPISCQSGCFCSLSINVNISAMMLFECCVKLVCFWSQKSGFKVTGTLTLSGSHFAHVRHEGVRMTPNATTTPNERFSNIGRAGPDIRALACGILRHRGGQSSSSVCCSVAARCVRGGAAGGVPASRVKKHLNCASRQGRV